MAWRSDRFSIIPSFHFISFHSISFHSISFQYTLDHGSIDGFHVSTSGIYAIHKAHLIICPLSPTHSISNA